MIDVDSEDGREHGVTVLGPLTDGDDPWEKPERFAIVSLWTALGPKTRFLTDCL